MGSCPVECCSLTSSSRASISLQARAQEVALAESRSRSELLERMNAMNLDFLHQVAHELKTPLTVISGYAQLTGMQMSTGHISSETPENLKVIRSEAQRLSDMVTKLMEYSYGRTSETQLPRWRWDRFWRASGPSVPPCA